MIARLAAAVLLLMPATAALAAADTQHAADPELLQVTAPVVIDGTKLFDVRGVSAFPADERAQKIVARIQQFAADPGNLLQHVRLVHTEDVTSILGGNQLLISVSDADARLEGLERRVLAELYRDRIVQKVGTYRADRAPETLLRGTLYASGALMLLVLALSGVRAGFRRVDGVLERWLGTRLNDIRVQSLHVVEATHLLGAARAAIRGMQALLWIVAIFVYLEFVLPLFPWTRALSHRLLDMVLDPLGTLATGFLEILPDLVFLTILFYVVRYGLKTIRLFFAALADGRVTSSSFEQEWAWPTYRIVRALVVAFAVVVAYPYIPGSDSDAFKGVSLFLGVIFSLGSTSVISNIMAGYTLSYRRAFRIGDRVQIGENIGDVIEQRLLVTHVRSPKNEEIIIPNSLILNTEVVNYSAAGRKRGLILHTSVGIGYEVPWRQVEAMLLQAAARTEGLLIEPKPFVLQKSLGDFAVNYEINAYCGDASAMYRLYTTLHQNILDVFNEYGVQIMTPAYEGDPPEPKIVPKERWHAPPATTHAAAPAEVSG